MENWLKYFQSKEDLSDKEEEKNEEQVAVVNEELEEAKDLYKTVLDDNK